MRPNCRSLGARVFTYPQPLRPRANPLVDHQQTASMQEYDHIQWLLTYSSTREREGRRANNTPPWFDVWQP